SDPWRYRQALARCADHRLRRRDVEAAVRGLRERIARETPPPGGAAGPYQVTDDPIVWLRATHAGARPVPLAGLAAPIVQQVVIDDGAECRTTLAVEGRLCDGTLLPRVEVPAGEFGWMRWPLERWGTRAAVCPGPGVADHLRYALQRLSGHVPTRTVFAHLGWRAVAGEWYYLHAAGGIGPSGPVTGVEVQLPDALARYVLPPPPDGPALA